MTTNAATTEGMFEPGTDVSRIGVSAAMTAVTDRMVKDVRRWLPVVLLLGVVQGLLLAYFDPETAFDSLVGLDPNADAPALLAAISDSLGRLQVPTAISVITSQVSMWFFVAWAVAAVRGRERRIAEIVTAGLLSIAAFIVPAVVIGFPLGILWIVVVLVLPDLALAATAAMALATIVLAVVVTLRLFVVMEALFDGTGFGDAFRLSWAATRGNVLTVVGWWAVAGFIGIVLSVPFDLVSGLVATVSIPLGGFLTGVGNGLASVFGAYLLVILYARLRARLEHVPPRRTWIEGSGWGPEPPPDQFDGIAGSPGRG